MSNNISFNTPCHPSYKVRDVFILAVLVEYHPQRVHNEISRMKRLMGNSGYVRRFLVYEIHEYRLLPIFVLHVAGHPVVVALNKVVPVLFRVEVKFPGDGVSVLTDGYLEVNAVVYVI